MSLQILVIKANFAAGGIARHRIGRSPEMKCQTVWAEMGFEGRQLVVWLIFQFGLTHHKPMTWSLVPTNKQTPRRRRKEHFHERE